MGWKDCYSSIILPSRSICLGGAGVVDLDIFVSSGARVSKQVRADRNGARVVAVTSEINKVFTNKSLERMCTIAAPQKKNKCNKDSFSWRVN